jgi:hypothetical protein
MVFGLRIPLPIQKCMAELDFGKNCQNHCSLLDRCTVYTLCTLNLSKLDYVLCYYEYVFSTSEDVLALIQHMFSLLHIRTLVPFCVTCVIWLSFAALCRN